MRDDDGFAADDTGEGRADRARDVRVQGVRDHTAHIVCLEDASEISHVFSGRSVLLHVRSRAGPSARYQASKRRRGEPTGTAVASGVRTDPCTAGRRDRPAAAGRPGRGRT
ncbi:hypothetical protein GCM10009602_02280 [Nocardiopsis tropica]